MDDDINNLVIIAELHRNKDSNSGLICLEWSVENKSSEVVTIYGYRLYFLGKVGNRLIKRKIPENFHTNPHVVTTLWEGEKRSYLWKWVHPKYYGITKPGKWRYKLQIAYRIENQSEIQKTKWVSSRDLDINVVELSDIIDANVLQRIRKKIPKYLQNRFELESKPRCRVEPQLSFDFIADQMCYTKDGWVAIINYKKIASLDTLVILNHYLQIAKRKYARNPESAIGVVVADQFDEPFLARVQEFRQIYFVRISEIL